MSLLSRVLEALLGKKIDNQRIPPLSTKIVITFTLFLLVLSVATNYINLSLNRIELVRLTKDILINDLKDAFEFCDTQYELYLNNRDFNKTIAAIEKKASLNFKNARAVMLGVDTNQALLFQASGFERVGSFSDTNAYTNIKASFARGVNEVSLYFMFHGFRYYGVYKYNPRWDIVIIRAEELTEYYSDTWRIFAQIAGIILIVTLLTVIIGIIIIRRLTRFLDVISDAIRNMTSKDELKEIDLTGAVGDEITFLGMAFNSLSNTVSNLVYIFRKFVNKDIAIKAYREREVRLEGSEQQLTMLFSDIKGFTYITETLGTDIIKLLNMHYIRAIRKILDYDGIIGSIIGDALLAVFGTLPNTKINKSYQAVISGFAIQRVAEDLRKEMVEKREMLKRKKGSLSQADERVFKAVLLEVGVGIDGGSVFYGNLGSHERMTNTVIGDTVNSAARLEGLTREYHVGIIISEFVKNEIEKSTPKHNLMFLEIDTVQVKGKTIGKEVYFPIEKAEITPAMENEMNRYAEALTLYYAGEWKKASKIFESLTLPCARVFCDRTSNYKCPEGWDGIWQMTKK